MGRLATGKQNCSLLAIRLPSSDTTTTFWLEGIYVLGVKGSILYGS